MGCFVNSNENKPSERLIYGKGEARVRQPTAPLNTEIADQDERVFRTIPVSLLKGKTRVVYIRQSNIAVFIYRVIICPSNLELFNARLTMLINFTDMFSSARLFMETHREKQKMRI